MHEYFVRHSVAQRLEHMGEIVPSVDAAFRHSIRIGLMFCAFSGGDAFIWRTHLIPKHPGDFCGILDQPVILIFIRLVIRIFE